jgi:hypothetical protein
MINLTEDEALVIDQYLAAVDDDVENWPTGDQVEACINGYIGDHPLVLRFEADDDRDEVLQFLIDFVYDTGDFAGAPVKNPGVKKFLFDALTAGGLA